MGNINVVQVNNDSLNSTSTCHDAALPNQLILKVTFCRICPDTGLPSQLILKVFFVGHVLMQGSPASSSWRSPSAGHVLIQSSQPAHLGRSPSARHVLMQSSPASSSWRSPSTGDVLIQGSPASSSWRSFFFCGTFIDAGFRNQLNLKVTFYRTCPDASGSPASSFWRSLSDLTGQTDHEAINFISSWTDPHKTVHYYMGWSCHCWTDNKADCPHGSPNKHTNKPWGPPNDAPPTITYIVYMFTVPNAAAAKFPRSSYYYSLYTTCKQTSVPHHLLGFSSTPGQRKMTCMYARWFNDCLI